MIKNYNDYYLDYIFEKNQELPFILSDELIDIMRELSTIHSIALEFRRLYLSKNNSKVTLVDVDNEKYSPSVDQDIYLKRFTIINSNKAIENFYKEFPQYKHEEINRHDFINISHNNKEIWKKNRVPIKIGAFVKKIFGNKFKESGDAGNDIESFVNMVYAYRKKMSNINDFFEIVEGYNIVKYYDEEYYVNNDNSLGESCMRYSRCSNYIEFYAQNEVKMLILHDPNYDTRYNGLEDEDVDDEYDNNGIEKKLKIVGRALIWDLKEPNRTFMDRIYTSDDKYIELFKNYARENKWLFKSKQNYDSTGNIIDGGDNDKNLGGIRLISYDNYKQTGYDEYPYIDTLCYHSLDDGFLTNNLEYANANGSYNQCRETDGGFEEYNRGIYVDYYGDYFNEDELIWCDLGSEYRKIDDAILCGYYDEYATQNYIDRNMEYSSYDDNYYKTDDVEWVEKHNSYILKSDLVDVIESSDYDTFDEAYEDADTEYMLPDNDDVIPYIHEGETYYFDDSDEENFIKCRINDEQYKFIYLHEVWDKDKITNIKGKYYYFTDQAKKDEMIGQMRLF